MKAYKILKEKGVKTFGIHAFLASNTVTNEYYPMLARTLFELCVEIKETIGDDNTFVVGNIGNPYTTVSLDMTEDSVAVAEVSSFQLETVKEFQSITGQGIEAVLQDKTYYIGNKKLCDAQGLDFAEYEQEANEIASKGQTPMFVGSDGKVIGIVSVADTMKETSTEAIRKIRELGIEVHMLTGDNRLTADYIGEKVGVDHVIAEVLPNFPFTKTAP